jgi:hypothetical protein
MSLLVGSHGQRPRRFLRPFHNSGVQARARTELKPRLSGPLSITQ